MTPTERPPASSEYLLDWEAAAAAQDVRDATRRRDVLIHRLRAERKRSLRQIAVTVGMSLGGVAKIVDRQEEET